MNEASTKPYLIRAIHEWCADNGFTPYVAVAVDENTHVPREFVRSGEIVLNVSMSATNKLQLGNEFVEFQARFNGQARDIMIPVGNITAIYARENGHGMSFDVPKALALQPNPKPSPAALRDVSVASSAEVNPERSEVLPMSRDGQTSAGPREVASPKAGSKKRAPGTMSVVPSVDISLPDSASAEAGPLPEGAEKIVEKTTETAASSTDNPPSDGPPDPAKPTGGKPKLTRVK